MCTGGYHGDGISCTSDKWFTDDELAVGGKFRTSDFSQNYGTFRGEIEQCFQAQTETQLSHVHSVWVQFVNSLICYH